MHQVQQLESCARGLLLSDLPLLHRRKAGVQQAGKDRLADREASRIFLICSGSSGSTGGRHSPAIGCSRSLWTSWVVLALMAAPDDSAAIVAVDKYKDEGGLCADNQFARSIHHARFAGIRQSGDHQVCGGLNNFFLHAPGGGWVAFRVPANTLRQFVQGGGVPLKPLFSWHVFL